MSIQSPDVVATRAVALLATDVKDAALVRARRAEIVAAATALFARHGFHPTTVRDVARAAGVSTGSIYTYFPSKDSIIVYACEALVERFTERLHALGGADGSADAATRFRYAFATLVELMDEHSDLGLVIYRETASLNAATSGRVTELDAAIRAGLRGLLEEGIASGALRPHDVALRAQTAEFLAHMWALKRWWLRAHMGVEDYIAEQSRLLLGDITVGPGGAGASDGRGAP